MNCQQCRDLFEEAIDRALTGAHRRRFDLHLQHCRDCRNLYEAEMREHTTLFRAFNACHADDLLPSHADMELRLVKEWKRSSVRFGWLRRLPRWSRIAAVLTVFIGLVALATQQAVFWLGERELSAEISETGAAETEYSRPDSVRAELVKSSLAREPGVYSVSQLTEQKGERVMSSARGTTASLAVAAGVVLGGTAFVSAGNSCIISGTLTAPPASVMASEGSVLDARSRVCGNVAGDIDARYRDSRTSEGCGIISAFRVFIR